MQKQYNPDSAANQGEYSNHQAMRKSKTYIGVWNRIKRDPTNVGVLNDRPLPNGDFIDRFGIHVKRSSSETHCVAA